MSQLETFVKKISNIHRDKGNNIAIFSTPRSGSTWLMELIKTQSDFKTCNEPLNIRDDKISSALGIRNWNDLYSMHYTGAIKQYFEEITFSKHQFLNGNPFRKYYRPFSSRIVFKIINGGELIVDEIAEASKSEIIYLIRHPIAVSLSRRQLPRLQTIANKDIIREFTKNEIHTIEKYKNNTNHIIRASLSWCIQNKLALKRANSNWVIFTYEQLVLNPKPIIDFISTRFNFKNREVFFSNLKKPSAVTVQSRPGTQKYIKDAKELDLINKWRNHVDQNTIDTVNIIVKVFGLDIYDKSTSIPIKYVIK